MSYVMDSLEASKYLGLNYDQFIKFVDRKVITGYKVANYDVFLKQDLDDFKDLFKVVEPRADFVVPITKTKLCTKCKKEKTIEEFYKSVANKDGLQYYCKECQNAYTRKWFFEKNYLISEEPTQVCKTCGKELPLDKFPLKPNRVGYQSKCKECIGKFISNYMQAKKKANQVQEQQLFESSKKRELSEDEIQDILSMKRQGISEKEITKKYNITRSTIYYHINKAPVEQKGNTLTILQKLEEVFSKIARIESMVKQ
jgi:hypothetical protein